MYFIFSLQQLNDSSLIISGLSTYFRNKDVDLNKMYEYYPVLVDTNNQNTSILNKYFVMHGGLGKNEVEKDKLVHHLYDHIKPYILIDSNSQIELSCFREERQWRKWADDVLVHTLSPNVYRTKEEALQAFNWFSEVFAFEF